MSARSIRHHEVPIWLSSYFSWKPGMLWMGFKDTRKVNQVSVNNAFVRKNANTRTDYEIGGDGRLKPVKSDRDETILDKFDNQASPAADELIDFARKSRDADPVVPRLSPDTVEVCKWLILVQARRPRESQDRFGLIEDNYELYLDLLFKSAEEVGQQLPSREVFLEHPGAIGVFDGISQNRRANMASGDHPLLANKGKEFLAPLGLCVGVLESTTAEFVIGSHGITIVATTQGLHLWLPLAPDVAISFSCRPEHIQLRTCTPEFAKAHNRAALSLSARVAGRSKGTIQELLATLDSPRD